MVQPSPLIVLKPLEQKSFIEDVKEKRAKLPLPLRVLTSPRTTLVLGGVLGALLAPQAIIPIAKTLIPTTARGIALTGTATFVGGGVLASSPKARGLVSRATDPEELFRKGQTIGGLVEDPSKLLPTTDKPFKEKVKDIAKSAGLIAGGTAVVVGAIAGAKKLIPKAKGLLPSAKAKVPDVLAQQILPTQMLPEISQPLGAVQPTPKEEEPEPIPLVSPIQAPDIINKITFKPEINVRVSQNRKFINQQLLVTPQ